jgi:hypothetical protein
MSIRFPQVDPSIGPASSAGALRGQVREARNQL